MNLGNIEDVELNYKTQTTHLISKISFGTKTTLCIDSNMQIQYKVPVYQSRGEKEFRVYMYLTDSWAVTNFESRIPLRMTLTDLKRNFINRRDIDASNEYGYPLLQNICLGVRKNLDMDIGSTIDYLFDNPLVVEAQGNWIKRGWGHTLSYFIVGIKIFRYR